MQLRTFKAYMTFCAVLGSLMLALYVYIYVRTGHLFVLVFGIVLFLVIAVGLPLFYRKMHPQGKRAP